MKLINFSILCRSIALFHLATCALVSHSVAQASVPTPATDQLTHTLFLGEHFYWSGAGTAPESESQALLMAVNAATTNQWPESLSALEDFIGAYPQSGWIPSVHNELARAYHQTGRYTLALQHWEAAWQATKDFTSGPGKKVADFTLAHWTRLLAMLGRYETLVPLFAANQNRQFDSAVLTKWLRTREAVAIMGRDPEISYQCGSFALFNAATALNMRDQAFPLKKVPSPSTGFSLKALSDLSVRFGLGFVPVKRESGMELVVPSVVHWKQNHYAAIVSRSGEFYQVVDPTFGSQRKISEATLNAEASGFFMVPSAHVPQGFRELSSEEASTVFGRGFGEAMTDFNDQSCGGGGSPSPPGFDGPTGRDLPVLAGGASCGTCGSAGPVLGMPQWRVSEPYINLWIEDEPLAYQPAIGPRISFNLHYKQRKENIITGISGVGPNCSCSWISAINASAYFVYHTFSGNYFTAQYGQSAGQEDYYNLPTLSTNWVCSRICG